jgi:response regulator RpfG family c-di-GMP phosphodiesterase
LQGERLFGIGKNLYMPPKPKRFEALIVDDDPDVRRTLSSALKAVGFRCDTAADGEHARQMLVVQNPDLLVTDLRMPILHGHRLVVDVFGRKNPPMVVVVTGLVEPAIASDLMLRGVADLVLKPFDAAVCAAKWLAMLRYRERIGTSISGRPELADVAAPSTPIQDDPSTHETVTSQIALATDTLRQQLKQITTSFEETIQNLETKHENLTAGFLGSVRLLTQLMRQFDGAESTHAARVERLAEGISDRAKSSRDELRNIRLASLLHDLGMFGMPDSVRVTSPDAMNPVQLDAYRRYPEIGATLLSEVPGCASAVGLILAHAENFDGTGFPRGLRGRDIPIGARIIRLADGVDSFGMYHKGPNLDDRLATHLLEQRGIIYDPELVDASFEFLMDSLILAKLSSCTTSELEIGDVLDEDLLSPQGHIVARRGGVVNETMKKYVKRIMGEVTIRIRRSEPT